MLVTQHLHNCIFGRDRIRLAFRLMLPLSEQVFHTIRKQSMDCITID